MVKIAATTCLAILAWLALAASGTLAWAHPETFPQLVSRYLTATLNRDQIALSCVLQYGEVPGRDRRRAMDSNHDGTIDEAELDAERTKLARQLPSICSLDVDGQPTEVTAVSAIDLGGNRGTGLAALLVEVGGYAHIAPGVHELRFSAGPDPLAAGETELTVDVAADWRVGTAAARGESKRVFPQPRSRPDEPRAAQFHVEYIGEALPEAKTERSFWVALLVAGAALLSAFVIEMRRRAARNQATQPDQQDV